MNNGDETTSQSNKESKTYLASEEANLKTHMIINLNANMLVMSQMVGEMAVAVKQVATKISDVEARRRRDRLVFGFCVVVLVMVGAFIRSQVRNNSEQLTILRKATSPTAQAAQAQQTQKVVKQIACDGQQNNQKVLLSVKQIVPNLEIPELDPECLQFSSTITAKP